MVNWGLQMQSFRVLPLRSGPVPRNSQSLEGGRKRGYRRLHVVEDLASTGLGSRLQDPLDEMGC